MIKYRIEKNFKKTEIGLIPVDWEVKEIRDFCLVIGGGTPSTKDLKSWNGQIPWITPKDMSNINKKYINRGARNITEYGLKKVMLKLFQKVQLY